MIYLKFPKMEKLLLKDTKELGSANPKVGVCVMMDHAVVLRNRDIVFFNLKDYFVKENDIDTDKKLGELKSVLDFMNGKMFTKAFWEELTKGAMVSIDEDRIELEGAVRKDLIYEYREFVSSEIETYLKSNASSVPASMPRKAFYVDSLLQLFSTFKTMLQDCSMAIESTGANTPLRYAFDDCPWIWGIMQSDPDLTSKNFIFNDLLTMNLDLKKNGKDGA